MPTDVPLDSTTRHSSVTDDPDQSRILISANIVVATLGVLYGLREQKGTNDITIGDAEDIIYRCT